jgi:hypothetical protein
MKTDTEKRIDNLEIEARLLALESMVTEIKIIENQINLMVNSIKASLNNLHVNTQLNFREIKYKLNKENK